MLSVSPRPPAAAGTSRPSGTMVQSAAGAMVLLPRVRQSHLNFWLAPAGTEQRGREDARAPTRPFAFSFRAKPEDQGQERLRPSF